MPDTRKGGARSTILHRIDAPPGSTHVPTLRVVDGWKHEVVVGAAHGDETVGVVGKSDGTLLAEEAWVAVGGDAGYAEPLAR